MAHKVRRVRIVFERDRVSLFPQGKTARGTSFTLGRVDVDTRRLDRAGRKDAIAAAMSTLLGSDDALRQ